MAKGFQCDKCKSWQTGFPAELEVEAKLKVEPPAGPVEFYVDLTATLRPSMQQGDDFCEDCRNDAIVDALSQWIQLLQKKKEAQRGSTD